MFSYTNHIFIIMITILVKKFVDNYYRFWLTSALLVVINNYFRGYDFQKLNQKWLIKIKKK